MAALSLEKIEAFTAVGYGDVDGYGYGYGSGDGSGYGSGDGYGYGYGSGDGSGYGSGDGYGSGSGYGDGDGDGYGYGSGIKMFSGEHVVRVDGMQTILHAIHGNTAKGSLLNGDLTLSPCFVVKAGSSFAHGLSLRDAMQALETKLFEDMPVGEKIDKFLEKFDLEKSHPAKEFYDWHNRLTGSCEMGRKAFAKEKGIDIDHDQMTVAEFIALTRKAFGGSVIRQLEERILENAKSH